MDEPIVVGIDVGTTKICTLVGRVEQDGILRILGVGIEPSQGMRKGVPVDVRALTQSISRSIEKAEHTSGLEITSALVSLAGSQVSSVNSRGVVGVSGRTIGEDDVIRSMEAARAVAIPHNREIIHVIQRGFTVDGQPGIRMPLGMHGYRLEVETHIITVAASAVEWIGAEHDGALPHGSLRCQLLFETPWAARGPRHDDRASTAGVLSGAIGAEREVLSVGREVRIALHRRGDHIPQKSPEPDHAVYRQIE